MKEKSLKKIIISNGVGLMEWFIIPYSEQPGKNVQIEFAIQALIELWIYDGVFRIKCFFDVYSIWLYWLLHVGCFLFVGHPYGKSNGKLHVKMLGNNAKQKSRKKRLMS